jgi:hypothetical protein
VRGRPLALLWRRFSLRGPFARVPDVNALIRTPSFFVSRALRGAARLHGAIATNTIVALLAAGCLNVDTPYTWVVLDNDYPASAETPLVVYEAFWQAVTFSTPVPPGASSDRQSTVPASDNTAYAVLAPGWDPTSSSPPTSFVVLQSSQGGFAVNLNRTLHIPVDDTHFAGNCSSGSVLTQTQADFITQIVFPSTFAGLHYDAATCTTASATDGSAE